MDRLRYIKRKAGEDVSISGVLCVDSCRELHLFTQILHSLLDKRKHDEMSFWKHMDPSILFKNIVELHCDTKISKLTYVNAKITNNIRLNCIK